MLLVDTCVEQQGVDVGKQAIKKKSPMPCCWISKVLRVEFTSMMTKGNKLRTARKIQNA